MSPLETYILSGLLVDFLFASGDNQYSSLSLTVSLAFLFTVLYDYITIKKKEKKLKPVIETVCVFASSFLAMMTVFKSDLLVIFDNFWLRLFIGLYWISVLMVAGVVSEVYLPALSLNWQRKFYHFLSVLLFTPAVYLDLDFLRVAMAVALNLFIALEYYRTFYEIEWLTRRLERNLKKQEDRGGLIVAHIQLLLGCALPVWMCDTKEAAMTGIISLGIGDAMASIIGIRYGRHKLGPKSIEGLLAFIMCSWIMRMALQHSWRGFSVDVCLGVLEMTLPSKANDSIILSVTGMILMKLQS